MCRGTDVVKNDRMKSGLFDQMINIICVVIVLFFAVNEFSHLYRSLDTIKAAPDLYERHYTFSTTFPFVGSYFLMEPKNYDPKYSYPLVVVLHGVSTHAYAAEALANPKFRDTYPFFVMVPIAPKRAFWASPEDKAYRMKQNIPYPDNLPHVIAGVNDIQKSYVIDERKVMISGHSAGGSGVIGALEKYPDVFKAGIASSGAWSPNEISHIKSPLFIYHGTNDAAVPVQYANNLKQAAKALKKPISVKYIKGQGHGIGGYVYSNPKVWDRLLSAVE